MSLLESGELRYAKAIIIIIINNNNNNDNSNNNNKACNCMQFSDAFFLPALIHTTVLPWRLMAN